MVEPPRLSLGERLSRIWWLHLPLGVRRLSSSLAITLVDGLYLATRPWVGFLAPPIALALGGAIGALHPGFDKVFSESVTVLAIGTLVGVLSGHLGTLFLAGYAVGDFFIAHAEWPQPERLLAHITRVRLPLLIEYGLLSLLVRNVPMVTKGLLAEMAPPARLSERTRLAVAMGAHAVMTGALVFLWTQTVPLLIRPIYTWQGKQPPSDAIVPLQGGAWLLVVVAVGASLARMVLQGQTAMQPSISARMDALEQRLASARPLVSLGQRVPASLSVVVQAAWATLILSGMLDTWLDGLILGVLILFVQAARTGIIKIPLGPWPALVERIPLLARLVAGMLVVGVVSSTVLHGRTLSTESFRPVTLLTALSLVILYLLAPGAPQSRRLPQEQAPEGPTP